MLISRKSPGDSALLADADKLFVREGDGHAVSDERVAALKEWLGRGCGLDPTSIGFRRPPPHSGTVVLDGTYLLFWTQILDYRLPLLWPIDGNDPCVLLETGRKDSSLMVRGKPAEVLEARSIAMPAVLALIEHFAAFCEGTKEGKCRLRQIGIAADGSMIFLGVSGYEHLSLASFCDIATRQADNSFVWSRERRVEHEAYRGRPGYYAWKGTGNRTLALHESPPDPCTFVCWDALGGEHLMTDVFIEWISTGVNAAEMAPSYTIIRP